METTTQNLNDKKRQIFEETVKFYTEDPSRRAFKERDTIKPYCFYHDPETNKRCAVGRLFPNDPMTAHMLVEWNGDVDWILKGYKNNIPEHILELGSDFLMMLQRFHDTTEFWNTEAQNGEALTKLGKEYVERFRACLNAENSQEALHTFRIKFYTLFLG